MHTQLLISSQLSRFSDLVDQGFIPASPPHPDILLLDGPDSIGIDEVREITRYLQTKPLTLAYKFIVIIDAARLTLPAQHALLKTLEEPPHYTRFILTIQNRHQLLPTILSRCFITHVKSQVPKDKDLTDFTSLMQTISQATIGQRVELAQTYTTKDKAQEVVNNLTQACHRKIQRQADKLVISQLKYLLSASQRLQQNAHPLLTIEHLFIHW